MSSYLASVPYPVCVGLGLLGVFLWLRGCDKIGRYLASREPVPEYDWEALQAELDAEFAPVRVRK